MLSCDVDCLMIGLVVPLVREISKQKFLKRNKYSPQGSNGPERNETYFRVFFDIVISSNLT